MGRALPFLTRDAEWQQACSDIHTILDNYITNAISEQKKASSDSSADEKDVCLEEQ